MKFLNLNKIQKKLIIVFLLIFFTFNIFIFYEKIRIPKLIQIKEAELRNNIDVKSWEMKKVAIINNDIKNAVEKYTLIDDRFLKNNITFIEIPEKYLGSNVITNEDQLKGKLFNVSLNQNQIIYSSMLMDENDWFEDMDRAVEIRVRHLVGDKVKPGNLIDLIINYEDGTYDVVLSKVKVNDIINPYEEIVVKEDGTKEYVVLQNAAARESVKELRNFIIIVNVKEEEFININLASKFGYFDTRKYLDEDQPASQVTFKIEGESEDKSEDEEADINS